ncbi:hypothetical protein NHQ30_008440 [Ciborinia camelliae]|nr:hypothetical protein NHQ30_008440 [Ciborinia camelliae]
MDLNVSDATFGSNSNVPKITISPNSSFNNSGGEIEKFILAATLEKKTSEMKTQHSFNKSIINPSDIDPTYINDFLQSSFVGDFNHSESIESKISVPVGVLPGHASRSDSDLDAIMQGCIHENKSMEDNGSASVISPSKGTSHIPSQQPSHHSNASVEPSSTDHWPQKPFATYREKVHQLCCDIGLGEPSNIEHMYGGNFNQVIGLSIPSDSGQQHFVLRVPRGIDGREQTKIRDQAETLTWLLHKFDFLCVPRIIALDTTSTNYLESPYVIQELVPGKSIEDLFWNNPVEIPLSKKLEVVTAIAEFIIKLENINLDRPGRIIGTHDVPWTSTSIDPSKSEIDFGGFALNCKDFSAPLQKQDLPSLLSRLMDAQKALPSCDMDKEYGKLRDILKEMEDANFFKPSDSNNVLWYWDLAARHIFVNKSESGTWEVSGTIDWDDVKSAPLVLTRAPKAWLWYNEDRFDHCTGYTFAWCGDYDIPLDLPLNEEVTAIKERFDHVMQQADPTYIDDTYGRGVWIRRLARFTRSGFLGSQDFRRYEKFVGDWDKYMDRDGSKSEAVSPCPSSDSESGSSFTCSMASEAEIDLELI